MKGEETVEETGPVCARVGCSNRVTRRGANGAWQSYCSIRCQRTEVTRLTSAGFRLERARRPLPRAGDLQE